MRSSYARLAVQKDESSGTRCVWNLLLVNLDRFHHVALLDGEDHVHAAGDFAEDGVAGGALNLAGLELAVNVGVEVGSFGMGYEELRGVGVESSVRHR